MRHFFEIVIVDVVVAERLNEFFRQEDALHVIVDDRLKLLPVSQLSVIRL